MVGIGMYSYCSKIKEEMNELKDFLGALLVLAIVVLAVRGFEKWIGWNND